MRLVYGWGINDADYVVRQCPIHRCWKHMIERCHCSKFQARRHTYVGCRIDKPWRSFMAFREWYLEQAPENEFQLDKDYLGDGKLYSPETCCFIPRWLNVLFIDAGAIRGPWPQGVRKQGRKFRAGLNCKGKTKHLGYSDTPEEASAVYLKAKAAYVEELLIEFPQPPRLAAAIRRKMSELIQQETILCKTLAIG